jgi:hypothetical protein
MAIEVGPRWPGEYKMGTTPLDPIPQSYYVKGLPDGVQIILQYARGEWRSSNQGLGLKTATTKPTRCPVFASEREALEAVRDLLRRCFAN